jgi:hypothetical protein
MFKNSFKNCRLYLNGNFQEKELTLVTKYIMKIVAFFNLTFVYFFPVNAITVCDGRPEIIFDIGLDPQHSLANRPLQCLCAHLRDDNKCLIYCRSNENCFVRSTRLYAIKLKRKHFTSL